MRRRGDPSRAIALISQFASPQCADIVICPFNCSTGGAPGISGIGLHSLSGPQSLNDVLFDGSGTARQRPKGMDPWRKVADKRDHRTVQSRS